MYQIDRDDDDDDPTLDERPAHTSARVLVADDDEAMRLLVAATLAGEGYTVAEASSGPDVVRKFDALSADLVVLDFRMPGMTGIEVIEKLRARDHGTPIILMTAFADPGVCEEADRLGVPVLSKPFPLEHLTRTAVLLLAQRHAS